MGDRFGDDPIARSRLDRRRYARSLFRVSAWRLLRLVRDRFATVAITRAPSTISLLVVYTSHVLAIPATALGGSTM
jgi:hypothetical protein